MVTFQSLLHGRVVIKYGTNALTRTDKQGNVLGLNSQRIDDIARLCGILHDRDIEIIIVSSGAVVAGMEQKGLRQRPKDVKELQDLATDRQLYLFLAYAKALEKYKIGMRGPLLVTHHNFITDKERANLLERVERGFAEQKISVFNTNDAVTKEELVPKYAKHRFTDNDPLAAYVAVYCKANSLIFVSEEGNLGRGGGDSKTKAFRYAERHGIQTNRGIRVIHKNIEELLEAMTHDTNNMGRL